MKQPRITTPFLGEQSRYRQAMAEAADQNAAEEEIRREVAERVRRNELRRALSHSIINLPAMTG